MTRRASSLRARFTLWCTILLGLPLIGFAVASYLVFARTLEQRTDRFIGDALTAFSNELVAERRTAGSGLDAMRTTIDEVRFRDLHIVILDSTGNALAMTAASDRDAPLAGRWPDDLGTRIAALLRGRDTAIPLTATVTDDGGAYRVLSRVIAVHGQRVSVAGTYSLRDNDHVLERVRQMFIVAIPLLVLASAVGGYLLAKRGLAPVSAMAARAADITPNNLHARLPVTGGEELAGLARVVNDLLDRLESSFAQQQRFVADASHELRTPAAILRAEADITLSRDHRAEPEYRASMTIVQNASRRLARIVDDLFLLARADAGHLTAHNGPLYLDELVHDATRAVRSVADHRGARVELRRLVEAPMHGDADLLGQLLLNLLDNAIKYSPRGGTVAVDLVRSGPDYQLTVADAGPGIPAEARDRVFERFFRLDTARSRAENSATSGAGLGLAIARRIAEIHAGRLEIAESRPGRTVFRLSLPAGNPPRDVTQ